MVGASLEDVTDNMAIEANQSPVKKKKKKKKKKAQKIAQPEFENADGADLDQQQTQDAFGDPNEMSDAQQALEEQQRKLAVIQEKQRLLEEQEQRLLEQEQMQQTRMEEEKKR